MRYIKNYIPIEVKELWFVKLDIKNNINVVGCVYTILNK